MCVGRRALGAASGALRSDGAGNLVLTVLHMPEFLSVLYVTVLYVPKSGPVCVIFAGIRALGAAAGALRSDGAGNLVLTVLYMPELLTVLYVTVLCKPKSGHDCLICAGRRALGAAAGARVRLYVSQTYICTYIYAPHVHMHIYVRRTLCAAAGALRCDGAGIYRRIYYIVYMHTLHTTYIYYI